MAAIEKVQGSVDRRPRRAGSKRLNKNRIRLVPSFTGVVIGRLHSLAQRTVGSKELLHVEADAILLAAIRNLGGYRGEEIAAVYEHIRERIGFGYSTKDPVFEVKKVDGDPENKS